MRQSPIKKLISSLALAVLLAACSGNDATDAIRALIEEAETRAEAHNIRGLMDLTTDDFVATPGPRDKREVKQVLWLAFRHYREFNILYPEPIVALDAGGKAASAAIHFLIVRKDAEFPELEALYRSPGKWIEAVGDNADLYRLEVDFKKAGGDWMASRASLQPFTGIKIGN